MIRSIREQRPDCSAPYHDTYGAYQNVQCRCPKAREDWRLYNKRRREGRDVARKVDPTGTRRRIEALMALGHTTAVIGRNAGGIQGREVRRIGSRDLGWVSRQTAAAIAGAFEKLSATVGASEITRRRALRRGFAPPLAWDDDTIDDPQATPDLGEEGHGGVDDVAVERVARGERPFGSLAKVEQIELYRRHGGSASSTALARRWGVSGDRMRTLAARAKEVA